MNDAPKQGEVTPAGGKQGYEIVSASIADDSARILALWREGLTQNGRPEAKLDWFYKHSPEGMPDVYFLLHGNRREPVGVAAVGRRRMRFGTEMLLTGELVDFVVLPRHRTLFPALLLQKALHRQALGLGTHTILYGLPNSKSAAVFSRAGYNCVGQMVRRVRVLRFGGYLSRFLPVSISGVVGGIIDRMRLGAIALRRLTSRGFRSQWLKHPDAGFDDLWQRSAVAEVLMGVRDMAFLKWRFVDCPLYSYEFFTLVSTDDQRLVAYAVCEELEQTLHVRDFLVDPNRPGAWARLWLDLSLDAFRLGCTSISLEFLGGEQVQRGLDASGMAAREKRPLYASATARWEGLMQERHWYLTCADEDG